MTTKIYKSYSEFLARKNKDENGVSESFADDHHDFVSQNETNNGCWNCSDCSDCSDCSYCWNCSGCSGCSGCSYCSGCSDCSDCWDCSYCWNCSGCSGCSDCSDCSYCWNCSDCSGCWDCSQLKGAKPVQAKNQDKSWFDVPIISNIHQTILNAVQKEGCKLDMEDWHHGNPCGSTHCRAGWVVHEAGEKGRALEKASSTLFAAMQIYKASSPIKVSPVRFFETDEVAMADMERCAREEAELQKNK